MPNEENLDHIQNNTRVSVALASFNGEKFIEDQINSILECLGNYDELIISDDGSTDNTLGIIKIYAEKDKRVKLLDGPKMGVIKNFENALNYCTGEYIFLSDQDDIWNSDKVEKILPLLNDNILVCHNAEIFDNKTGESIGTIQDKIGTHKTIFKNIIKNSFIGCCLAFRKELLNKILPFPSEKDIHIHDWWIGLTAIKNGKVYFEKECLIKYRIHEKNTLGFNKTSLAFKLRKRFNMIKYLIKNR